MINEEVEIEYSEFCQKEITDGTGELFELQIYKGIDEKYWIVELVDSNGNSFSIEDEFENDGEAFSEIKNNLLREKFNREVFEKIELPSNLENLLEAEQKKH